MSEDRERRQTEFSRLFKDALSDKERLGLLMEATAEGLQRLIDEFQYNLLLDELESAVDSLIALWQVLRGRPNDWGFREPLPPKSDV